MTPVLLVEDDQEARLEIIDYLERHGYSVTGAESAEAAHDILLARDDLSLVISDIRLPGRDGLDFLGRIKDELGRDIHSIVITGHGGFPEAVKALRNNAVDFLLKPLKLSELLSSLRRAEEKMQVLAQERLKVSGLESKIRERELAVSNLTDDVDEAYRESLESLVTASEYKDPETGSHIRRIGAYSRLLAEQLGMDEDWQQTIEYAAPLHDAGKIGTPDKVLSKPGKLSPEEVAVMKEHPVVGHRILSKSRGRYMRMAAEIALSHHERWDGTGYPQELKEEAIPLSARIVAFVDVYDALRSERPYKPAFDHEKTMKIMLDGDGRTMPEHFDPSISKVFKKTAPAFAKIFDKFVD